MEPGVDSSRTRILGAHLRAGFAIGMLFGFAYFVLEALFGFSGPYECLGAPLSRVLGVYLLFGLVVGVGGGLVAGMVSALAGFRWHADRCVPFYLSTFAFLLIVMYALRNHSIAGIKSLWKSSELIWILVLLIVLVAAGYALSRILSGKPLAGNIGRRGGSFLIVLCIIAVAAVQSVAFYRERRLPSDRSEATFNGPNVVFVLLDALRADHVSAYGYHRDTTPNLDKLARDGVLFRNAHSHGNRTIISVPAIFTSLYPAFHGVVGRGKLVRPLQQEFTTIAELLQEKGYTTVGMMDNVYLKRAYGLNQGFDRVENFYGERYQLGLYKTLRHFGIVERPRYAVEIHPGADEVTRVAMRWLERVKERPFFMYVHYMDTHHPYAPPPPYDTMYGSKENVPQPTALFRKTTQFLREPGVVELDDVDLAKLKDYYDGSIRFADDQIGRLVEEVIRVSGERETIVVITADHGDEFLEHGSLYHNNLVFEELIHVPLILWSSKRFARGSEVDCLVRHIDILPTLAELIGADAPSQAMGQSLVPLLEGKVDSIDVESVAEGNFCTSLNYQNWKIMKVDSTNAYPLYDLSRTPREKEDLSAAYPEDYSKLHGRLVEYLEKAKLLRGTLEREVDEKTIRELKALGYL